MRDGFTLCRQYQRRAKATPDFDASSENSSRRSPGSDSDCLFGVNRSTSQTAMRGGRTNDAWNIIAATPLSKGYSDLTRQSIFDLLSLLRPTLAFRYTLLPATAEKISFSPAVAENAATYGPTMIPVRADVPPTPCGETHHGSY